MTLDERTKTVTDEVGTATTGAELRVLIAEAIAAAVEETEERWANIHDRYVQRLEAENAELQMKVRRLYDINESLVRKL